MGTREEADILHGEHRNGSSGNVMSEERERPGVQDQAMQTLEARSIARTFLR